MQVTHGLSCAKHLTDNGMEVDLYEKTNQIGGMVKCIDVFNNRIEKYYRHIFKSDKYVLDLIRSLKKESSIKWNTTKMGYYSKEGLYEFGTPISLLKYKPLSFIDKIRFGKAYLKIKLIKDYKKIENVTAEDWIIKNSGRNVYEKIWEPLLISKFGKAKDKISMAWLWGKINLRSSSGKLEGESLGYYEGSFSRLTDAINDYLIGKGCKIILNSNIQKIHKEDSKWIIETEAGLKKEYDSIVSTIPYSYSVKLFKEYLTEEEKQKMNALEYTSAKILIIFMKQSFSNFYWMNIGDSSFPFGGIMEHTNMIDKKEYGDNTVLYISNYLYKSDPQYNLSKEDLLKLYIPYLKKINPDFNEKDIVRLECFEEEYAQPIIKTDYSKDMLDEKLNEEGLYVCTMGQIYPEDRGINYAIREGINVANQILNK